VLFDIVKFEIWLYRCNPSLIAELKTTNSFLSCTITYCFTAGSRTAIWICMFGTDAKKRPPAHLDLEFAPTGTISTQNWWKVFPNSKRSQMMSWEYEKWFLVNSGTLIIQIFWHSIVIWIHLFESVNLWSWYPSVITTQARTVIDYHWAVLQELLIFAAVFIKLIGSRHPWKFISLISFPAESQRQYLMSCPRDWSPTKYTSSH
jgi:hypothetical protein